MRKIEKESREALFFLAIIVICDNINYIKILSFAKGNIP